VIKSSELGGITSRGRVSELKSGSVASAVPECELDRNAILGQLDRILSQPLFKNSRRYPNLLRYLVERTLDGGSDDLKERTLGIDVFGREPDYDTNLDPVVRTTAAEIRKRLAQYYQDPAHESELRIELPLGSYAARFHLDRVAPAPLVHTTLVAVPAPITEPPAKRSRRTLAVAGWVAAASLLLGAAAGKLWPLHSALDRLWNPVLESQNAALLCVGQRPFVGVSDTEPRSSPPAKSAAGPQTTLYQLYYLGSQNVGIADVITMGRLTGFLQAKGKAYHIRGESSTTFEDLRDGPVVLVGAFNNDWSMRVMGPRRFSFERDGDLFWIKDAQNPSDRSHAVNYTTPYLQVTEDYALICRLLDPVTERMVVLAGGLTGYGTLAAGEFLTNPQYMASIAAHAPAHWERKNIQVLISTKVINGRSGPPKALIAHFW
jgi:hypothetical protein